MSRRQRLRRNALRSRAQLRREIVIPRRSASSRARGVISVSVGDGHFAVLRHPFQIRECDQRFHEIWYGVVSRFVNKILPILWK